MSEKQKTKPNQINPFQIVISVSKDGQFSVSPSRGLTPEESMTAGMNLCLSTMKLIMEQESKNPKMTKDDLQKLKGNLYDGFNFMASRTLELFAPEIELRPDLTVDAIKAKEDELYAKSVKDGKTKPRLPIKS